jgi:pseudouridine-5'-monophosphatase
VISAVIFDMDGLMIDSEPLQKEAWQATLRRYGHEMDDALFGQLLGLRTSEDAILLRERFGLPVTAEALLRQCTEVLFASLPGRVKPMPGLYELLAGIKARAMVMRELELEGAWDARAVAQNVTRGKPAPDVYLLAARRLGLPPAQCLVLEDAPNGIAAAKFAGMKCVAVPNEFTRSLDLSAADASMPSLLSVRDQLDVLIR